jgi:hypothetical protein
MVSSANIVVPTATASATADGRTPPTVPPILRKQAQIHARLLKSTW